MNDWETIIRHDDDGLPLHHFMIQSSRQVRNIAELPNLPESSLAGGLWGGGGAASPIEKAERLRSRRPQRTEPNWIRTNLATKQVTKPVV